MKESISGVEGWSPAFRRLNFKDETLSHFFGAEAGVEAYPESYEVPT